MMTANPQSDVRAAIQFAVALGRAIHDSGPDGIPSGNLYAIVMDKCSLQYYERAIRFLKDQGIAREENNRLFSTI